MNHSSRLKWKLHSVSEKLTLAFAQQVEFIHPKHHALHCFEASPHFFFAFSQTYAVNYIFPDYDETVLLKLHKLSQ